MGGEVLSKGMDLMRGFGGEASDGLTLNKTVTGLNTHVWAIQASEDDSR